MLDNVLDSIPDKREDKNTTSLKFKRDLISYLGEDYKDKVCLEIGTSRGYSTKILSHLFKKVITCETNVELLNFAKGVNKDRDNIVFLNKDVYNTSEPTTCHLSPGGTLVATFCSAIFLLH